MATRRLLLLALNVGLFLPGCGARPTEEYSRRVGSAQGPVLHAVHSQRLRQIMDELESMFAGPLPQELDLAAQQERRLESVARLARATADSAARIPEVLSDVELSKQQRVLFSGLALRLKERAVVLEEQAQRGELEDAIVSRGQIESICQECHQKFRVLPMVPIGSENDPETTRGP